MMTTLLSEASFLGFEGTEAIFVGALIVGMIFAFIGLFAGFYKDTTKTDIGEKICSILMWISLPAMIVCLIVEIVYGIKM